MTVAELIEALKALPQDAPVIMNHEVYPAAVESVTMCDPSKFLFPPVKGVTLAAYLS